MLNLSCVKTVNPPWVFLAAELPLATDRSEREVVTCDIMRLRKQIKSRNDDKTGDHHALLSSLSTGDVSEPGIKKDQPPWTWYGIEIEPVAPERAEHEIFQG